MKLLRRLIAPLDRLTRPPTAEELERDDAWYRSLKRREAESIAARRRDEDESPFVRSIFGEGTRPTRRKPT